MDTPKNENKGTKKMTKEELLKEKPKAAPPRKPGNGETHTGTGQTHTGGKKKEGKEKPKAVPPPKKDRHTHTGKKK